MKKSSTTRRQFLGLASAGVATLAISRPPRPFYQKELQDQQCAVIGTGIRGRDILSALSRLEGAVIGACCDVYEPFLRRAARLAPEATAYADYRELLAAEPDIQSIFVATPTHLHHEIVEAALAAGRHVYCEAPLASTIEDCRAIAKAARGATTVFATGLQNRANPIFIQTSSFLRSRATGIPVTEEGQWYENNSWRRTVGDRSFEEAMNWRLNPEISPGLLGEAGVHTFDNSLRFRNAYPVAVSAFGSIMKWHDGRSVHDTVFSMLEYEDGYQSTFKGSLANSFRERYFQLHGSDGTILIDDYKSWWFKEATAPSLGWEVYADRDRVGNEEGIVLRADATQQLEEGQITADEYLLVDEEPLYMALQDFLHAVADGTEPACGYREGFDATVIAIMANEAIRERRRIELDRSLFDI